MRQPVVHRRERECGRAFDGPRLVIEPQIELEVFDGDLAVGRVVFVANNRFALDVDRGVVQIDVRPLARIEQRRVNERIVDSRHWRSFDISPTSCKPLSGELGVESGEWGMGNRELGLGITSRQPPITIPRRSGTPTPHSPLPIPYSPLAIPYSLFPTPHSPA